jgi:hypothetical protein
MSAAIASRTPEGVPGRCTVCQKLFFLDPSRPACDAPCPHCGSLAWIDGRAEEFEAILALDLDLRTTNEWIDGNEAREPLRPHGFGLMDPVSVPWLDRFATRRASPRRHRAASRQPFWNRARPGSQISTWFHSIVATVKSGAGPAPAGSPSYGNVWDPWLDG